ncbi:MAG: hypothetical protein KAQ65_05725 [Candidatus Thorarchaeota archaeon]|nr:hypothetical protein [Candidatus Thorarchaeota archaeon]MCK5238212.1 hypothetical protein [Candidatus Thorarchaeota archaeon]
MIASIDTGDNSTKKPQFRQRVIKSLISTVTRYNAFLKELRDNRMGINHRRESGEISFKEYWNQRIGLESKIQDTIERRDTFSRELVLVFAEKTSRSISF